MSTKCCSSWQMLPRREMRQTCMTHENFSLWTLLPPIPISNILVTVIRLNNEVINLKGRSHCQQEVSNNGASYQSHSCTRSRSTFTVNVEEMSAGSHCRAMSEKLKWDSEMCLDSFGVTNQSRGHHPSTDSAVREVRCKHWHLHRTTSMVSSDRSLFTLTLATGPCEAAGLDPVKQTIKGTLQMK